MQNLIILKTIYSYIFLIGLFTGATIAVSSAQTPAHQLYKDIVSKLPDDLAAADSLSVLFDKMVADWPAGDSMHAKSDYIRGVVKYYKGEYLLSEKFFKEAIELQADDPVSRIREACLNNLGVIYDKQDRLAEAMEVYQNSLQVASRRADSFAVIQTCINISLLDTRSGNNSRAMELCQRVIDYSERHGDSLNLALAHQNAGHIWHSTGNPAKRDEHYQTSLAIYRAIGQPYQEAVLLLDMGNQYIEDNDFVSAGNCFVNARNIVENGGFEELKIQLYAGLGVNAIYNTHNYRDAEDYLNKAVSQVDKTGLEDMRGRLYLLMLKLYVRTGDTKKHDDLVNKFLWHVNLMNTEEARISYEQVRAFYEIEELTQNQLKLESDIRQRNFQLISLLTILSVIILSAIALWLMYRRQIRYRQSLFSLNLADIKPHSPVSADVDNNPTAESENSGKRFSEILHLLEEKKLFLDSGLNIQAVSTMLGTNQKYVSQAVNKHGGTNFSTFINRMRVAEARRLMLTEEGTLLSLGLIAERSGFNNLVSFHRQFKDITGFTPGEFQKLATQHRENIEWEAEKPDIESEGI